MKAEVKVYNGDWVVFVNDDPKFSFMYQDEAIAVRNVIEALVQANDYIIENAPDEIYPERLLNQIEQSLKDAGAL